MLRADVQAATVEADEVATLDGFLDGLLESGQGGEVLLEAGTEGGACGLEGAGGERLACVYAVLSCDLAELFVACPVEVGILVFSQGRYALARLAAASRYREEQTISSPACGGARRFGPLGPTPRRDSRCTFQII